MSYYGFDPPAMQGWVNLGLAQIGDGNCQVGVDNCNMSGVLDAWEQYQIPSLYGNLNGVFVRGVGLAPGWEAALEALVARDIKPNMGEGKALLG